MTPPVTVRSPSDAPSLVVVTILVWKRKRRVAEQTTVDDNVYYGVDEYRYMDSIRDHRVIDNNDYYE